MEEKVVKRKYMIGTFIVVLLIIVAGVGLKYSNDQKKKRTDWQKVLILRNLN